MWFYFPMQFKNIILPKLLHALKQFVKPISANFKKASNHRVKSEKQTFFTCSNSLAIDFHENPKQVLFKGNAIQTSPIER